jgi:uncharacterized spore protein YtfJ
LVVNESDVQLLSINGKNMLEKVFESIPKVFMEFKDAFKDKSSEEVE